MSSDVDGNLLLCYLFSSFQMIINGEITRGLGKHGKLTGKMGGKSRKEASYSYTHTHVQ